MKIKLSAVKQVSLSKLKKNKKNEEYFMHPDGGSLHNLKEDVKRRGILVPLIARKDGTLLAGHSRLMIAGQLKLQSVPVQYVEDKLTNQQEIEFIIKDNLLRRQLGPEERKALYRKIYKDFEDRILVEGKQKDVGINIKELAEKTGLKAATVAYDVNMLRHKAKRVAAANRKVDSVDVRAVDSFKKSCAKMLNAAMVSGKSTQGELQQILKSAADRLDGIIKIHEQKRA